MAVALGLVIALNWASGETYDRSPGFKRDRQPKLYWLSMALLAVMAAACAFGAVISG